VRERDGVGVVFGNVDAESVRRRDCGWVSECVDRIGMRDRSSTRRGASTRGLNIVGCNWKVGVRGLDVKLRKGVEKVRRWLGVT